MVERGKGDGAVLVVEMVGFWVVDSLDEGAEDGDGAVRVRRMPSVVSRARR